MVQTKCKQKYPSPTKKPSTFCKFGLFCRN
nr:MAG TPA: hypothetical protein [Caudoviricetes sp.]